MLVTLCMLALFSGLCASIFTNLFGILSPIIGTSWLAVSTLCVCLSAGFLVPHFWLRVVLSFGLGLVIASFQMNHQLSHQLPLKSENAKLWLQGDVVAINEQTKSGVSFDLKIKNVEACPACDVLQEQTIRLSWRHYFGDSKGNAPAAQNLRRGQHLRLLVKLKRPRGLVNPSGFDYRAWLLSKSYMATGYVVENKGNQSVQKSEVGVGPLGRVATLLDSSGTSLFRENLSVPLQQAHYLQALLLGDRSDIKKHDWQILQNTGTIHLMAISGLHVGLVATFSFFFMRLCLSLFADALSVRVIRMLPIAFSLLAAGAYVYVSGMGIPGQRAWFGVLFFHCFYYFGLQVNPLRILLSVAIIIAFNNPFVLTQTNYWLSFVAVSLLVLVFYFNKGSEPWWWTHLKSQWVLLLGLSFLLYVFHLPLAPVSLIANTLAVPVVGMIVLPSLLVCLMLSLVNLNVSNLFLLLADRSLDLVIKVLMLLNENAEPIYFSFDSVWSYCAVLFTVLLLLLPRGFACKPLGLVLLCAFIVIDHRDKSDQITILDVGQGLSVVLQSDGKTLIYDTGAKFSEKFDIGADVVAPFLRSKNIKEIDALVLSHNDFDHAGGAQGLLDQIPVHTVYANDISLEDNGFLINPCIEKEGLVIGSFDVRMLWPHTDYESLSSNDRSCVLLLRCGNFTALFTGDIGKNVEAALLSKDRLPQNIDLLIAPHHGSNSSSSKQFIQYVNPAHVVFSSGYLNRYRHPSDTVIDRYQAYSSATLWETAEQGAIILGFEGDGKLSINSARELYSRAWD